MSPWGSLVFGAILMIGAAPAAAQGLADLHDKRREGNRLCMSTHFHNGNSSGHASRKVAEQAAVKSWQDFTAWEYGPIWGNYRIAGSRSVNCNREGVTWSCHVMGRPCRRL